MKTRSVVLASLILSTSIASAQNTNVTVTVFGASGPWVVTNNLNTAYPYAPGFDNNPQSPTTIVSASSGLPFSVGDGLTICYQSGSIVYNGYFGPPYYDANGNTNSPLNNEINGGYGPAPSYYMNPTTYPIYVGELVGTFANSIGEIVGTPFAIGDLGRFTIPVGASQLQLGVNDNDYGDNSGSWSIQVSETAVPEPTTAALVLMGTMGLGRVVCRRK